MAVTPHSTLPENAESVMGLLLRLREFGITDQEFLQRVESVPHDIFVPREFYAEAWKNTQLPIPCGQTQTSPDLLIRILSALELTNGHTVLEIGTGSGYLTALLARFSRKVRSIDRYGTLIDRASKKLAQLEINNVTLEKADGLDGPHGQGLYDRIVVDSCFQETPRALAEQLVAGGVVITAIGEVTGEQMLVKLTKIGSRFDREDLFPVRLTPLEPGISAAI